MINHPRRSAAKKAAATSQSAYNHDDVYSDLLDSVKRAFAAALAVGDKLFTTDASGLYDRYLASLPFDTQTHNCNACRRFIETYGGLVFIDPDGATRSVLWNIVDAPEFYLGALAALRAIVEKARVTGVFLTKQKVWGLPVTGNWSHLAVVPPAALVYREGALTDSQAMAAAKENFRTVATALTELTAPMLDEALRLLQAEALARSEKFVAPVKWLRVLHDRPKGRRGENVLWRAIASAPEGYCHPRTSVIAPLLDDIAAGLPFAEIKKRFDAKLRPLAYQRPQAAPTVGNIKAAEAMFDKLGLAPALERRFARIDDLQQVLWTPKVAQPIGRVGGVFGHLQPKDTTGVRPVTLPTSTVTWDKFTRTVLPAAEQIEIRVPGRGAFLALTTAADPDAPPILKWDRDDARNPVSWYVYPGGSVANQWGLNGGTWTRLTAITPLPTLWGDRPSPFIGEGVVLVIEGAVDSNASSGNALFPECLKDDLHAVRATIEAFSRSAVLHGRSEASACGYDLRKNSAVVCDLRVLSNGALNSYHIDRWD